MSKSTLYLLVAALVLLLGAALGGATYYYSNLPQLISQQETIVLGQTRFNPGSQTALRVVVRDTRDATPLVGAEIRVSLRPTAGGKAVELYTGQTDASGTANVSFLVPDGLAPQQDLLVETSSNLGNDTFERAVTVDRDYRVLLSTDKPLYQPGQVIHLRALALSTFDLTPATGQELEVVIADGKGNKVFRTRLQTSDFGVASVDFQLANEVNTGPYKITTELHAGEQSVSSEKTVTVEHYVLPKFKIDLQTEKPYYQPGERVSGHLDAAYFFGKPVAGGQVVLEGYTFDVERKVQVTLQGVTGEDGGFEFQFDLPEYIAGSDLEGGLGRFYLQLAVTDLAQHTETANRSLPVSQSALLVEAIPEGGTPRPGIENIIYFMTSYPDGSPAQADLQVSFYQDGSILDVNTGPYGLAEVRIVPGGSWLGMSVSAQDGQGNYTQRDFNFEGPYSEESVLLRPKRPVYRVGETMGLLVLTSQQQGTVYLDIVREGQTISTRSVEILDGQAELAVDLSPDLYGTLELHAYKVLSSGMITRDTRLVVVDRAADLQVDISAGQDTYRPGETGSLNIQVSGQDGVGVRSALGLAVVDEAVFALAEQDPGFAKLYFMLEQQILVPRYDLHGYTLHSLIKGLPEDAGSAQTAIENAAQASLAAAVGSGRTFGLQANTHEIAMQRAYDRQERYFTNLSKGVYGLLLLIPVGLLILAGVAVWRAKNLGRSLVLVAGLVGALLLAFFFWPVDPNRFWWGEGALGRLQVLLNWIGEHDEALLVVLAAAGLLGFIGLLIIALRQKDRLLGLALGLVWLFIGALALLVFALSQSRVSPSEGVVLAGLLALALMPVAFLLRSASFAWQQRLLPAGASLLVALFLLGGTLPAVAMGVQASSAVQQDLVRRNFGVVDEALAGGIPPMMQPAAGGAEIDKATEGTETQAQAGSEPPRLRQYFPETMFWLPEAITGEDGALILDLPLADSITTWRITALASSRDGRLGSTTAPLRVFQDFFIDLDLPLALTVGDEVSIPVGVFNYLPDAQAVRLELEPQPWFELRDDPVKEITIASNDIQVVYFRVRAVQFGRQPFQVTAWGSQMSDAIRKEVRVFPDGKALSFTHSDRLTPGETVRETVVIPSETIAGTQTLVVKIYPGVLSQIVEGLDAILRMPYGCFEQTSSTTYPNVLVLDYLKTTGQAAPEMRLKAEEYINLGYQRLATFEVNGGGFSLFGDAPADRMLTAYGLQEFADMSRVYEVDPDLVRRAAEWLLGQQAADGSWENDQGLVHENTWSSLGNDRLPVTAYITWSLVEAGFGDNSGTQKGLAYVREHAAQAEDAYVTALVGNALVAADLQKGSQLDASTRSVLDSLAGQAVREGSGVYWQSGVATFMGSEGRTGSIETTALAALALLRSEQHSELANAALTYLVQQKDNFGTWHNTQATVLSLKALLQSIRGGEQADAELRVRLNGGQERVVQVNASNFDVVQLVSFDDVLPGENRVEIEIEGQGSLMYQVSGGYYLPWDKLGLYPELQEGGREAASIQVAYDRTELAVDDTVRVSVQLSLNEPGSSAQSAMIDLGLPPGFTVQAEDLQALVAYYNDLPADFTGARIQRFELTGRQILIYVTNLTADKPLEFSYRLRAKFPLTAQTPPSSAYDYYNPEVTGESGPQMITVTP